LTKLIHLANTLFAVDSSTVQRAKLIKQPVSFHLQREGTDWYITK